MSDFDAIVVGGGLAGSVAAYTLAQAEKSVLLVERGNYSGSKNMTGGRLYVHSLGKIFPDFETEAPLERKITHERISLMAPDSNFTVDFSSEDMKAPGRDSYSVLRGPFDQWLCSKAEDAGAEVICGIPVEALLKDDSGKVCGIRAGEDELTSDVVILCDGVNSLLAKDAVGYDKPPVNMLAIGAKEVLALPAQTIEDRVLCDEGEGAAWLFCGDATHGKFGGGFMYTNKESISLGVVVGMDAVTSQDNSTPVYQMLADFKEHPAIKPLIKGAETIEYSGHIVPEGGVNIMPPLVGNGVMLAGDTAMMCINLGYMVRGMDYAIEAGRLAGINAAKALDAGDTSQAGLNSYVEDLKSSIIMRDLVQFRSAPAYLGNANRMFGEYPAMVRDVMNSMFIVDGQPLTPLKQNVKDNAKKIGYGNLMHDMRGAMKAL